MDEKKEFDDSADDILCCNLNGIEAGTCCVCGHPLSTHINEDNGMFRCHSLGKDIYQCECRLVKFYENDKLDDFDLKGRMEKHRKEFKEGRG